MTNKVVHPMSEDIENLLFIDFRVNYHYHHYVLGELSEIQPRKISQSPRICTIELNMSAHVRSLRLIHYVLKRIDQESS